MPQRIPEQFIPEGTRQVFPVEDYYTEAYYDCLGGGEGGTADNAEEAVINIDSELVTLTGTIIDARGLKVTRIGNEGRCSGLGEIRSRALGRAVSRCLRDTCDLQLSAGGDSAEEAANLTLVTNLTLECKPGVFATEAEAADCERQCADARISTLEALPGFVRDVNSQIDRNRAVVVAAKAAIRAANARTQQLI